MRSRSSQKFNSFYDPVGIGQHTEKKMSVRIYEFLFGLQ